MNEVQFKAKGNRIAFIITALWLFSSLLWPEATVVEAGFEGTSTDVLTIEQAVELALENSEGMLSSRESVRIQELNRGSLFPKSVSVGVSGSVAWDTSGGFTAEGLSLSDSESISLSLPIIPQINVSASVSAALIPIAEGEPASVPARISLGIFPLADNSKTIQADLSLTLSKHSLEQSAAGVELDVRNKYIAFLSSIKTRVLAEENYSIKEQNYNAVKSGYDLGLGSQAALLSAEKALWNARIGWEQAKKNEYSASLSLSRLVGMDLVEEKLADLPQYPERTLNENEIMEKTLSTNIGLKKSQLQLIEAERSLKNTRSLLPDLGITAAVISDIPKGDYFTPQLSLNLSWSLSGSRSADIEKARIQLNQMKRAQDSSTQSLIESTEIAIMEYKIQLMSIEPLKINVREAQKRYDEAMLEYEKGKIGFIALEEIRISRDQAVFSLETGWYSMWRSWYSLSSLIGG